MLRRAGADSKTRWSTRRCDADQARACSGLLVITERGLDESRREHKCTMVGTCKRATVLQAPGIGDERDLRTRNEPSHLISKLR